MSLTLLGVFKSVGQNVVLPVNSTTPSTNNVIIGPSGSLINNAGSGASGGYNVLIGLYSAGSAITTGESNTVIGPAAGQNLTTGVENTFMGYGSGRFTTTGSRNIYYGKTSGYGNISGQYNICLGTDTGYNLQNGSNNLIIGTFAGIQSTSGYKNNFVGYSCGQFITKGNSNSFFGYGKVNNIAVSTTTQSGNNTSNTVVLADGDGNTMMYVHNNGYTGFNLGNLNDIPQNSMEIGTANAAPVTGTLGLRFRGFNNPNFTLTSTSTRKVLSINTFGDVILVDDIGGGITQNCSNANFVPVNSTTAGQLNCSQIFDNSTSVGIGLANPTSNNWNYSSLSTVGVTTTPTTGTVKFDVNGVIRSSAYLATSDKKFKKDIKPIENALETIQKIEGKTYLWNKESFKDRNFDAGGHSGFIAQELEKVLPHLVATGENGDKAVNYMELMPYLVEAIKEQQIQINDLKTQIAENFKVQNHDLFELTNTKIINVSPNPSNDMITVSFNVERSVQSAKLQVHDLNGNVISSLNISDRDNNITRTLQKDNFGKGIYVVSLVINGKSIDTKKIVFN